MSHRAGHDVLEWSLGPEPGIALQHARDRPAKGHVLGHSGDVGYFSQSRSSSQFPSTIPLSVAIQTNIQKQLALRLRNRNELQELFMEMPWLHRETVDIHNKIDALNREYRLQELFLWPTGIDRQGARRMRNQLEVYRPKLQELVSCPAGQQYDNEAGQCAVIITNTGTMNISLI